MLALVTVKFQMRIEREELELWRMIAGSRSLTQWIKDRCAAAIGSDTERTRMLTIMQNRLQTIENKAEPTSNKK